MRHLKPIVGCSCCCGRVKRGGVDRLLAEACTDPPAAGGFHFFGGEKQAQEFPGRGSLFVHDS